VKVGGDAAGRRRPVPAHVPTLAVLRGAAMLAIAAAAAAAGPVANVEQSASGFAKLPQFIWRRGYVPAGSQVPLRPCFTTGPFVPSDSVKIELLISPARTAARMRPTRGGASA